MKFEIKQGEKTYEIDDLKLFDQQSKAFQKAFNEAEKETADSLVIAKFDNGNALLYTKSNRVLIELKETEDENI